MPSFSALRHSCRRPNQPAGRAGLDIDRFIAEMERGAYEGRVCEDFMSGVRSGVNGTPTFFINGLRHDDSYDLDTLLAALEVAEQAARAGRV